MIPENPGPAGPLVSPDNGDSWRQQPSDTYTATSDSHLRSPLCNRHAKEPHRRGPSGAARRQLRDLHRGRVRCFGYTLRLWSPLIGEGWSLWCDPIFPFLSIRQFFHRAHRKWGLFEVGATGADLGAGMFDSRASFNFVGNICLEYGSVSIEKRALQVRFLRVICSLREVHIGGFDIVEYYSN